MPRIPDNVLECSVYLYQTLAQAEQGEAYGGSGFFLSVPGGSEEPLRPESARERTTITISTAGRVVPARTAEFSDREHRYVVTNRHVASDNKDRFARVTTASGTSRVVQLPSTNWVLHPDQDEIAVCPIEEPSDLADQYRSVPVEILLDKPLVTDLSVGPGDDVFMVGRFVNHEGRQRNRPSIRFGHVAMMPDEKDRILSRSGLRLEGYLVEASSYAGYSGSPVFLYSPPWEIQHLDHSLGWRRKLAEETGDNLWLLGVNWGHFPIHLDARTNDGAELKVELNAGMMCVAPAWKLLEVLNLPELQRQRAQERELWRSHGAAVTD